MNACITRQNFCFYSFSASVSFNFETRIMSTCMSTSRSNYFDMSIWKKHADHTTSTHPPYITVCWGCIQIFKHLLILINGVKRSGYVVQLVQ